MIPRARELTALLLLGLAAIGCSAQKRAEAPEASPAPAGQPMSTEQAPASPAADAQGESEESMPRAAPAESGAGPMPGSAQKASQPELDRSSAVRDLERLSQDLESALRLSAPDCTTGWSLRDRICDLADRLCDMADRSAEPEVQERCSDGTIRCERATTRVRAACAE